jgi:hypothetical protein
MAGLKRSNLFCALLFLSIGGCATSSFKIARQGDLATELKVTPDRVLLECEYQHDNDTKGLYGFMIHILDDLNTVLTVSQMNTLDVESCNKRLRKVGQILKTGKTIYIGGMGGLREKRVREDRHVTFPGIGEFYGNGQTLQFIVIKNERGACFDAYSGDEEPCPRDTFISMGR